VPEIRFKLDESIKIDAALDAAIRDGIGSFRVDPKGDDSDGSNPDGLTKRDGPAGVDSPSNDSDDDSGRSPEDHEVSS
jgi:hypothetical protein